MILVVSSKSGKGQLKSEISWKREDSQQGVWTNSVNDFMVAINLFPGIFPPNQNLVLFRKDYFLESA